SGEWVPERVGRHTVHGAGKAYRAACLEEIGGLRPSMGWDGIDEYAAKARRWKGIPLERLEVLHHRARGPEQARGRGRGGGGPRGGGGRGAPYGGCGPACVPVRAGSGMLAGRPPAPGGLGLRGGWRAAAAGREPVVDDPLALAALRAEQGARLRRLLRGG